MGIKESHDAVTYEMNEGKTCMDELKMVIEMPQYDAKHAALITGDYKHVEMEGTQQV